MRVGAVDADVAGRAVLVFHVGHRVGGGTQGDAVAVATEVAGAVVAFQTKREDLGAPQEPGVHAAVGGVAGAAAIDANGGVFKDEGAAFVDVAFEAGFFVLETVGEHAGAGHHAGVEGVGAVGVMAIRALHEAFVDAVLDGHGELGADVGMALVAEIGLLFGEEVFGGGRFVDGVAIGADDVGGGVGTAADVGAADLGLVAGEAVVEGLFRAEIGEGDDLRLVTLGGDVFATGAVAAFAALLFELDLFVG